ncbi:MAG: hypothetical protein H0T93_09375 [Chloroflexia bacterium]|nr:hypothetical protein [Chloroflexia bacterium]
MHPVNDDARVNRPMPDIPIDCIELDLQLLLTELSLQRRMLIGTEHGAGEGHARPCVAGWSHLLSCCERIGHVDAGAYLLECRRPRLLSQSEDDESVLDFCLAMVESMFGLGYGEPADMDVAHHHGGMDSVIVQVAKHEQRGSCQKEQSKPQDEHAGNERDKVLPT